MRYLAWPRQAGASRRKLVKVIAPARGNEKDRMGSLILVVPEEWAAASPVPAFGAAFPAAYEPHLLWHPSVRRLALCRRLLCPCCRMRRCNSNDGSRSKWVPVPRIG